MVTIQKLFDTKYSEKKEKEIQFSDLNERKTSSGELTIENFPNLKKVDVNNVKSLTKLKIINCSQLTRLNCQNNNLLTSLDLSECNKLVKIQVSNNRLELIKLPTNSKELFHLEINDNNFPSQDLSFLAPYNNLEILDLGNNSNEEKVKKGIYNRFYGSLEPLKTMNNLWNLGIKGTDIDSGLEYLSDKLQRLNCSKGVRVEAKVKEIYAICGSNNSPFGFDQEKYKKFRQEQKTKTEQVSSNRKKNKSAKQKEKLEIAQEEIKQLKAELQREKDKKEAEWKHDVLNQDLIDKQEEIEKLRAENQELNKQLTNSNGIIEKKDNKISELISKSEKDKEEVEILLNKKDEIEKDLEEKNKSMEGRINQLTEENTVLFQQNEEWEQLYQELEKLNNDQSKDHVRQRISWKKNWEELEQIINKEKTKNQVLQNQVASQQDKLKTLQGNLQNNLSIYTNFVDKTLQIKKKEVEELTEQLNNLQNQVEISPK